MQRTGPRCYVLVRFRETSEKYVINYLLRPPLLRKIIPSLFDLSETSPYTVDILRSERGEVIIMEGIARAT